MKIKYNEDVMKYMSIFESLTNARLKDCFIDEKVTFIVEEGQIGKAIGKHGSNVRRIESILKKRIRIIEFNKSLVQFIKNIIYPNNTREIKEDNGIVTIVGTDTKTKSILIGRERKNLLNLKNIVKRYFPITEIKVI